MRKLWLTVMLLTVCAGSAKAQYSTVSVWVVAENPQTELVADALKGKIGSTERYALQEKSPNILVDITCLQANVLVCDTELEYYAPLGFGISENLTGFMLMGSVEYITQQMFNDFVESTTNEKLAKHDKSIRENTKFFQDMGYERGLAEGKKLCKPSASSK